MEDMQLFVDKGFRVCYMWEHDWLAAKRCGVHALGARQLLRAEEERPSAARRSRRERDAGRAGLAAR
eukprot:3872739-Prymnesium_polylepis.1